MAAVLFPSAVTLSALRHIDADAGGQRLVLCINAQWQPEGQVISDFGCVDSRNRRLWISSRPSRGHTQSEAMSSCLSRTRCHHRDRQMQTLRSGDTLLRVAAESTRVLLTLAGTFAMKLRLQRWRIEVTACLQIGAYAARGGGVRALVRGRVLPQAPRAHRRRRARAARVRWRLAGERLSSLICTSLTRYLTFPARSAVPGMGFAHAKCATQAWHAKLMQPSTSCPSELRLVLRPCVASGAHDAGGRQAAVAGQAGAAADLDGPPVPGAGAQTNPAHGTLFLSHHPS